MKKFLSVLLAVVLVLASVAIAEETEVVDSPVLDVTTDNANVEIEEIDDATVQEIVAEVMGNSDILAEIAQANDVAVEDLECNEVAKFNLKEPVETVTFGFATAYAPFKVCAAVVDGKVVPAMALTNGKVFVDFTGIEVGEHTMAIVSRK